MNQRNHWRTWAQLDLAEIMNWPSTPRRLLLLFASLIVIALVAVLSLIPLWQAVQAKQSQTSTLQQQYRQSAQLKAQQSLEIHDMRVQVLRPIGVQDIAQWYTDLVTSATEQQLHPVSLTPVPFKEAANPNQNIHLADQLAADSGVGQLTVELEGNYAHVLTWTHALAKRPEIISLERLTINGLDTNKVRAKMQLFFIKGAAK